jgi:hypothetical protein
MQLKINLSKRYDKFAIGYENFDNYKKNIPKSITISSIGDDIDFV